MLFSKRSAGECYGKWEATLVCKHEVELPFNQQDAVGLADSAARFVEPVERARLFKKQRLGRVHILGGLGIVFLPRHFLKKSARNCNRLPAHAKYREDNPPAKSVEYFSLALFRLNGKACICNFVFCKPLL